MYALMPESRTKPKRSPPSPEDIALGKRIKARRLACGLTQAQIAYRMGRSDGGVGHWEAGTARVNAVELVELARILRCSVTSLLGEDGNEYPVEDPDLFGYIGRMMDLIPPGLYREMYKRRVREDAQREAEFMRQLAEKEAQQ